ncbi:hypothetical protein L596_025990 [Steinernema carpocapsae]|uniref:Uncharacterized protein n=1 Tax=Steinernema carpocapsae TaxID=34508 RepID=A0A4V6XVP0_STECR|nr:hypothetical protein L596_025990 [Steinernema carpocapsae]
MTAPDGQSAIRSALGGGRVRPGPDQSMLCASLHFLCISFQWSAHLRRRPAPSPFKKGWEVFLKTISTAADHAWSA